jgi:hypothetical protein
LPPVDAGVTAANAADRLPEEVPRLAGSPGAPLTLTAEEEKTLVECAIKYHRAGFSLNRHQLKHLALQIMRARPTPLTSWAAACQRWAEQGAPSRKWVRAFLERNREQLRLRVAYNLDGGRLRITADQVLSLYRQLDKVLHRWPQLRQMPGQIYNVDETCFRPDAPNAIVLVATGSHHSNKAANLQRWSMTAVPCVAADGTAVPPMFILAGKSGRRPKWWFKLAAAWKGTVLEHTVGLQQVCGSGGRVVAGACSCALGQVAPMCSCRGGEEGARGGGWGVGWGCRAASDVLWCAALPPQASRYMDSEVWGRWCTHEHFLKHTAGKRSGKVPVVVILDNFAAHLNLNVLNAAHKDNVVFLTLPPTRAILPSRLTARV